MNYFLKLLERSNITPIEIKRIEEEVSYLNNNYINYQDPSLIQIFNKHQKLVCELTLREIFIINWEEFESIDDYILYKKNLSGILRKHSDRHLNIGIVEVIPLRCYCASGIRNNG